MHHKNSDSIFLKNNVTFKIFNKNIKVNCHYVVLVVNQYALFVLLEAIVMHLQKESPR